MQLLFKRVLLIVFLTVSTPLLAATVPANVQSQIPSILNPGLANKPSTQENVSTGKVPAVKPPQSPTGALPAEAAQVHFKLTQVIFVGNTVFNQAQLQKIVQPFINKTISLADLQGLANQITAKYWTVGYILSRAILPPQQIKNGVVTIQVVEGFVSHVAVAGDPGRASAKITAYGDNVLQSKPLKVSDLERNLLLANDIPGAQVKAVLVPSATTPASSDLSLVSQHQMAQGYVSYDNYGTRYLGPQEITLSGTLNSLFTSGDTTSAQIQGTPNSNEMRFFQLSHAELLSDSGTRLSFGGNYSKTIPGFVLEPIDVQGEAKALFADISYPWLRTRNQSVSVHSGIFYQNINTTYFGGQPFYDDHIRSLIAGTQYNSNDSWHGMNIAGLDVEHGFNILGANNGGLRSRPEGRSDFTKTQLNASRLQALSSRFSLFVAAQGQYAFSPLLASEQMGVGGPDFGRGYDPYEISGDQGIAGKAELRMDTNPDLALLKMVQYYVFYDAGAVWNINGTANGLPPRVSAISTGLGARVSFTKHLVGNLFVGQPLNHSVATSVAAHEDGRAPRAFFQISAFL